MFAEYILAEPAHSASLLVQRSQPNMEYTSFIDGYVDGEIASVRTRC